jgi:adenosylcobinamide kinase/adenosylcobinamide-phosphate guanylyltransferase
MLKYSNHDEILAELGQAVETSLDRVQWVIVSSEIGLGVVPADAESRRFRDLSGSAHQLLGRLADRVELMVAGIPLRVK